jgi:hypothetical protein
MSRIIVTRSSVEKPGTATPPIISGGLQAFRLPTEDTLEDDHDEFIDLKSAMTAYPDLPWAYLSVFGGEDIEPELLAAIHATVVEQLPVFAGEPVEEFYATRPVPEAPHA